MTRHSLLLIGGLSLVLPLAVLAEQQTPPRATPTVPTVGTAAIVGTVTTDEPNPRILRRAQVSLGVIGMPGGSRITSTDDNGRFALSSLPAGNYAAPIASKAGFVSQTFGAARLGAIGTPITLADGQVMQIAFKLPRGAVITGTVFEDGRPAARLSVNAMRVRTVNGVRTLDYYYGGGYSTTDDRGVFRIYGLPFGDYVVLANPRHSGMAEMTMITDSDIEWAQRQFQSGATLSSAPGASTTPPATPAVAYTPVYYPGTTTAASAGLVTLTAGQERSGVDFSIRMVATARVEGIVRDVSGEPTDNAQVTIVPRSTGDSLDSMMLVETMMMNRTMLAGGKFSIAGVRPGDYTVTVRGGPQAAGGGSGGGGRGAAAPAAMTFWATQDITVDGSNLTGLELRLQPGIDLRGRVAFEESATLKPPDLANVRIRLSGAPTAGTTVTMGGSAGTVEADGTFTISGVTPGRFLVYASVPTTSPGTPGGPIWLMKSARIGTIDAADAAFDVLEHRNAEILITFTDKVGELSGTLFDGNNKPTSQLSIILFPTDPAMWSSRSRRLRPPVRASTEGKFRFTQLLAGEYYMAALADFEQADAYKPEFLEQVAAMAIKVTIGEGEKKIQDLRIGK